MRFLIVVSLLLPSVASADIPVPNQELCTVEIQQRDGSECEACSWPGYDQDAFDTACGPLIERGLVRRCGYGATGAVAVYCDREADWLVVGGAKGGCNCDAGSAGASLSWLLALLLMRRRSRSRTQLDPGRSRRTE